MSCPHPPSPKHPPQTSFPASHLAVQPRLFLHALQAGGAWPFVHPHLGHLQLPTPVWPEGTAPPIFVGPTKIASSEQAAHTHASCPHANGWEAKECHNQPQRCPHPPSKPARGTGSREGCGNGARRGAGTAESIWGTGKDAGSILPPTRPCMHSACSRVWDPRSLQHHDDLKSHPQSIHGAEPSRKSPFSPGAGGGNPGDTNMG